MAKKISKLLLNEKKETMTDEQFFSSNTMMEHFNNIVVGVCKAFHRKIQLKFETTGRFVAFTNQDLIIVNLSTDWIKNAKSRIDKYYIIVGIILHECGHILHTDFKLLEKSANSLSRENRIFPKVDISEKLEDLLTHKKGMQLSKIYSALDNCIEDGHIEKRIIKQIPGYGECLMKVRKLHLEEHEKLTYEEQLLKASVSGKKLNRINCMLDLVLIYAKFGIDNTGDIADPFTEVFHEMKKHIEIAVCSNNAISRKIQVNMLFDKLIQFMEEEIEREDKENSSSSKSKDSKESEKAKEEPSKDETGDSETSEGKDKLEKELEDRLSELDKLFDEFTDTSDHSAMHSTPVEDDEESEMTEGEPITEEGSDFIPENKEGPLDWDLSYLEEDAAEELVSEDIKKGIVKKMAKIAEDTRKSRVDKFPSIETYVNPDEFAIRMYDEQHEELDRIARRVVKNLDKVIKERQKGDKLTGLYVGKQLDTARIYRRDKKIFYNKVLPEDVPDMEVCVLVDCSGSMSSGTRMEQSRKCAYITWKFCQMMKIPCAVYGHTTDWPKEKHVLMTCVAHPENIDKDDGKRIFMLRPEANNRDGWALNFCAEALAKSKASSKLLLIISDGLPAAIGYGERLGKMDCQEVVKRYKRKGITFITAGIDECATDIKNLYLEGIPQKEAARFLDYSDMTQLPKAFATVIKKELL